MKLHRKALFSALLVLVLLASVLPLGASAEFSRAQVSKQNLSVTAWNYYNGELETKEINCEKYNIDGNNYFKLRDIAALVNTSGSQFSVEWYAEMPDSVYVWTGEPYTPTENDLVVGADKSATAQRTKQTIYVNGVERDDLSVYNIGGNNYFKLRDLGAALNFEVGYVAETNTATVCVDIPPADSLNFYVDDVDTLMDFIGSDRTIYLSPGEYDLTDWLIRHAQEGTLEDYPAVSADSYAYYDVEREIDSANFPELRLEGLENLKLVGAGAGATTLVASPRYAVVLGFSNCSGVGVRNMTLGHTPEPGHCTGSVLYFSGCIDATLSGLELYGCGTYGIEARGLYYAEVRNTEIRDCSYGALSLTGCYEVAFDGCNVHDNADLDIIALYNSADIGFTGCTFRNNRFTFVDGCGFVSCNVPEETVYDYVLRFTDCDFGNVEYQSMVDNDQIGNPVEIVNPHVS